MDKESAFLGSDSVVFRVDLPMNLAQGSAQELAGEIQDIFERHGFQVLSVRVKSGSTWIELALAIAAAVGTTAGTVLAKKLLEGGFEYLLDRIKKRPDEPLIPPVESESDTQGASPLGAYSLIESPERLAHSYVQVREELTLTFRNRGIAKARYTLEARQPDIVGRIEVDADFEKAEEIISITREFRGYIA